MANACSFYLARTSASLVVYLTCLDCSTISYCVVLVRACICRLRNGQASVKLRSDSKKCFIQAKYNVPGYAYFQDLSLRAFRKQLTDFGCWVQIIDT